MKIAKDAYIMFGIIAALVLGGVLVFYLPQKRQQDQLCTRIAQQKLAIQADMERVKIVPEMVRQVEAMKQRYKDFDRRLPKSKELGGFLREISSNITEEKLEIQLIQPSDPTRGEIFNTLPIRMQLRGSYASLLGFVKRLEGMERLSRIQKLKIDTDDKTHGVTVEMNLNIYFTES